MASDFRFYAPKREKHIVTALSIRLVPCPANNYPVYLQSYLHVTIYFFIMDDCLRHILESTKEIEIKLGTYIGVYERKYRRQEP